MAILYDFAAAFPSVEHQMLFEYFVSLGWPSWLRNMILMLYSNNFCTISLGSASYVGFGITRGIRQGCPLSPLLFAAVSELLLRRLRRMVPDTLNRAYADDLAMVLRRGLASLPALHSIFTEFATISGLHISIGKTVLAPLHVF